MRITWLMLRRLTENREPTADKPDWAGRLRNSPLIFAKYVQYPPIRLGDPVEPLKLWKNLGSISLALATVSILSQSPSPALYP